MTTIYLVRHSHKMGIPQNMTALEYDRIQPLSAEGERRAKGLLDMPELRGADAACCSPFARTLSTLRYIMEADGITPTVDDRLRELDFGTEFMAIHPEPLKPPVPGQPNPMQAFSARQWQDRDLAAVGGESLNQCAARMSAAIADLVRDHPNQTVLVGSHGAAICAYLSQWLDGIDEEYAHSLPQPAVFRMHFDGGELKDVEQLSLPKSAQPLA